MYMHVNLSPIIYSKVLQHPFSLISQRLKYFLSLFFTLIIPWSTNFDKHIFGDLWIFAFCGFYFFLLYLQLYDENFHFLYLVCGITDAWLNFSYWLAIFATVLLKRFIETLKHENFEKTVYNFSNILAFFFDFFSYQALEYFFSQ